MTRAIRKPLTDEQLAKQRVAQAAYRKRVKAGSTTEQTFFVHSSWSKSADMPSLRALLKGKRTPAIARQIREIVGGSFEGKKPE